MGREAQRRFRPDRQHGFYEYRRGDAAAINAVWPAAADGIVKFRFLIGTVFIWTSDSQIPDNLTSHVTGRSIILPMRRICLQSFKTCLEETGSRRLRCQISQTSLAIGIGGKARA